jgi:hypothetical protein
LVNGRPLRSTLDEKALRRRMDAIRLKQLLDPASLSERELMCLQIEQHGFARPRRALRPDDPEQTA